LIEGWKNVDNLSLYNQALLIISVLRYFDKSSGEYKKAIQQLSSIDQLAVRDDVNGIRWKDIADSDDMTNSAEETLGLLSEAFAETGTHSEIFPGIIKWLLTAKTEDHWSSTKATAAVIDMLMKERMSATGSTQTISVTVNDKKSLVTDDLLSGTGFSFTPAKRPEPIILKKQTNAPAVGNVTWYYFSSGDHLSKVNKDVSLNKQFFRFNSLNATWEPIDENSVLKIADKIKVELTIQTSKALRYVHVDDKRAAAFEPKENRSGYEYGDGFSYYQSVRDAGMQFFSEFIPSGKSVISYEMIVAQEGNFHSGPAVLQCMYKPEVSAYSNSGSVRVGK